MIALSGHTRVCLIVTDFSLTSPYDLGNERGMLDIRMDFWEYIISEIFVPLKSTAKLLMGYVRSDKERPDI